MIDDIVFTYNSFILELPIGDPGGLISGYSLNGDSFDFTEGTANYEYVTIFIS